MGGAQGLDPSLLVDSYDSPLADAPAFLLLLQISSFIYFRISLELPILVSFAVSLLLAAFWGLFGTLKANRSSLPVFVLLLVFSIISSCLITIQLNENRRPDYLDDQRGVVTLSRSWGYAKVALIDSDEGVFLIRSRSDQLRPGDTVLVRGAVHDFKRASGRGSFDEYLYWRGKGALGFLEDPNITVTGSSKGLAYWRSNLNEIMKTGLPPLTYGYLAASWIGYRESRLEGIHRSAGTSHLLAVSGFHVGVVFGVAWFILRRVRGRYAMIGAIIWGYAFLSGAAPSALRAAFMIQIVMCGRMIGLKGNGFNSVSTAGCFLLVGNPWLLWDVGFELSMTAVLTLTALAVVVRNRRRLFALTSPIVWLTTSAVSLSVFGQVPIAGLVMNFLAIPVFAVLLPVASILSLPALLGAPLLARLVQVPEFLFRCWDNVSANVIYLLPQIVGDSLLLILTSTAVLIYLCAAASGFTRARSLAAAFLALALVALIV